MSEFVLAMKIYPAFDKRVLLAMDVSGSESATLASELVMDNVRQ